MHSIAVATGPRAARKFVLPLTFGSGVDALDVVQKAFLNITGGLDGSEAALKRSRRWPRVRVRSETQAAAVGRLIDALLISRNARCF
jgi:hypothetical protein